jgi:hypothetical protein
VARVVTAQDLRARLGYELDSLKAANDVLYVSKRRQVGWVLIEVNRYAEILDRLDFLEDSLAALQARDLVETGVPWGEVRRS